MKKISTLKGGTAIVLTGPIFALIAHLWITALEIDLDKPTTSASTLELCGFILFVSLTGGFSVAVSMGLVNIVEFFYKKIIGKKERDYF